ncbi:MAG TPA: glycoside hydrolase family 140 protein [Roseiflexaceae bacterium]|nr:glycoside hydrolase family 140 protein [Roseiflexaceae bacterium]
MVRVSDNRRFLVNDDGKPFFYLGDTAWELFHRCTLAETEHYLRDRAAKGFTVIQAVALAELDGLQTPNRRGDLPLIDGDPARPNEAYFAHVDQVVALAETLGLTIGLLPTWGDKWNRKWGVGPEIFTPENAARYGEWIGRRYADRAIIWILGGDRPIENEQQRAVVRAMANGVRAGDGGRHLIGFHTFGPHSSSEYVHEEPWLDLHMCQSGHARNSDNYRFIEQDYARTPIRPVMDAEPGYEDMPDGLHTLDGGYLDAYDARKALYWALFAGAHGHTYGCNPVWQMWDHGHQPLLHARINWREALQLPGAGQMQHARRLLLSRPFLSRIPDQQLLLSEPGSGSYHIRASRDSNGSYAFVYVAGMQPMLPGGTGRQSPQIEIDTSRLSGSRLAAWWFDPRSGVAASIGHFDRTERAGFTPPAGGPDWVLVLDDAAAGYHRPYS